MADRMEAPEGKEGYTDYHLCLSVRGALNQPKGKLRGWLRDDNGKLLTPDQARDALMDELAKGHEVIPMGECDNFDYKTGCCGHRPSKKSDPTPPTEGQPR